LIVWTPSGLSVLSMTYVGMDKVLSIAQQVTSRIFPDRAQPE
jgi:hypothetical protein